MTFLLREGQFNQWWLFMFVLFHIYLSPSFNVSVLAGTNSGYGFSQWEMTLQCNVISHWLSLYPEWSLYWWQEIELHDMLCTELVLSRHHWLANYLGNGSLTVIQFYSKGKNASQCLIFAAACWSIYLAVTMHCLGVPKNTKLKLMMICCLSVGERLSLLLCLCISVPTFMWVY